MKKADRIQRNGHRMAQKLNYIHKGFERNDVWDSLSFWKSEGFREELTRDKRQYLDCLIGFVEDVADNGEMRYQLGDSYRKDIAISFSCLCIFTNNGFSSSVSQTNMFLLSNLNNLAFGCICA